MRTMLVAAILAAGLSTSLAQSPPAVQQPGNNAVNSSGVNNSNRPVEGANSFTEGQAKSRIEAQGFTGVSALMKDDKGIWRGKATKAGQAVNVTVDFQGNVNTQ